MPDPIARHAVITGGSSGLGLALATALCAQGVRVAILARDRARLSDAHEAIHRAIPDAKLRAISCDVRDPAAVEAAYAGIEGAEGAVDLAIACAGAAHPGRFAALAPAAFRDQMELNYFGALHLAQAALPRMRPRGRGRLLLISSAAALLGLPGHAAYAPSKAALRALGQSLRAECAPDGVQVSTAFPADLDTPGLAAERPLTPPELAAISRLGGVMGPGRAAKRILRGLAKGRAEIHPGLAAFALARLAPLVLPQVTARLDRIAAKARAENDWIDRLPELPSPDAPIVSATRGRDGARE